MFILESYSKRILFINKQNYNAQKSLLFFNELNTLTLVMNSNHLKNHVKYKFLQKEWIMHFKQSTTSPTFRRKGKGNSFKCVPYIHNYY